MDTNNYIDDLQSNRTEKTGSNGEAPVLEICWVWSTASLPLLPSPLWPDKNTWFHITVNHLYQIIKVMMNLLNAHMGDHKQQCLHTRLNKTYRNNHEYVERSDEKWIHDSSSFQSFYGRHHHSRPVPNRCRWFTTKVLWPFHMGENEG